MKEGDVFALHTAIRDIFDDANLCKRMGEAGRKFIECTYNLKKNIKLLEEMYDELNVKMISETFPLVESGMIRMLLSRVTPFKTTLYVLLAN